MPYRYVTAIIARLLCLPLPPPHTFLPRAQDMLLALRSVFGDGLMRHVLLGFTRWDYSRRGRLLCEQRHAFACG